LDQITLLQTSRRENVSFLAIGVVQQGNAGCAIRIILDRMDLSRNTIFVAPKVNQPIPPLVTTTTKPDRNLPLIVAAPRFLQGTQQSLLRLGAAGQIGKIAH
jgi:hypothetical protein